MIYPEPLVLPTLCHVNLFLHPQALSLENSRYTTYIIVCQSTISAPKHSFKEQDRPLGTILIPYLFTCGTTPLHDPQCTPQTSSRLRASWLSASHNQPPACSPPLKAPRPAQAPSQYRLTRHTRHPTPLPPSTQPPCRSPSCTAR